MLKRISYRKQKRWWSAYILFYRRVDTDSDQCQFSLRLNELVLSNANINSNNLMRTSSSSALIKQNSGDSAATTTIASEHQQRKLIDTNPGEFYLRIPTPIRRSVQRQNIKFMHMRNQFNAEYFNFIKNLTSSNHDQLLNQFSNFLRNNEPKEDSLKENYLNDHSSSIVNEDSKSSSSSNSSNNNNNNNSQLIAKQQIELSFLCTKLLAKFLFTTCFHAKKQLRGSTVEWYEILTMHLRVSPMIRAWFAHNIMLVDSPCRFSEYILECISTEIRNVFVKLVLFISHYALSDGQNCQVEIELDDGTRELVQCGQPLSDYIMKLVLDLLDYIKKGSMDRHLNQYYNQYFNLFYQYSNASRDARAQLVKLSLPTKFMIIALDENIIPSLKSQYSEFGRLHQVVSILIRSCDISSKCTPNKTTDAILPNPYGFENGSYVGNLPADTTELLFNKPQYIKKVIEDATNLDETFLFLRYCCWENPRLSKVVLGELIWHVAFYYDNEVKPHLDLLLHILLMPDSWQRCRILNALNGLSNEKEGILDTILRDKSHYQKRAYECIKFLVSLFTNCEVSTMILQNEHEIRDKYLQAINWLTEELDRHSLNYTWSSSSNENNNNAYRLFRSNSVKLTLAKAINFCSKEDLFGKESIKSNDSDSNSDNSKQQVKVEVNENSQDTTTVVQQQSQQANTNDEQPQQQTKTTEQPQSSNGRKKFNDEEAIINMIMHFKMNNSEKDKVLSSSILNTKKEEQKSAAIKKDEEQQNQIDQDEKTTKEAFKKHYKLSEI